MIVRGDLVRASIARWNWKKATKLAPSELAQKLGEGEREQLGSHQRETRLAALMTRARDPRRSHGRRFLA